MIRVYWKATPHKIQFTIFITYNLLITCFKFGLFIISENISIFVIENWKKHTVTIYKSKYL